MSRKTESLFWEKVEKSDRCWIWTACVNDKGYGKVGISINGKFRTKKAHRLAWELQYGPIPDGKCVCHRCDNPPCVRPDHLFLGTKQENNKDTMLKGRLARGESISQSKLTEIDVLEIRDKYKNTNMSQLKLGKIYSVGQSSISEIVRRRSWRHI